MSKYVLVISIFSTVPEDYSIKGYRRYYISKGCDTQSGCDKRRAATHTVCSKDYYRDWACVECCVGDLCNYYVAHVSGACEDNYK